jgi:type I restriction enzyme S subunit
MQDKLKPYPQYKESETTWLGQVPYNWNITRLGAMFIERKEKVSDKDFSPLSVTKNGILPQLVTTAKTNDGDNRKKVCQGDFVINSRSDRKGSSGLSSLTGSVSLISTVLQPNGYNNKYSHYLLKSQSFQEEFYRIGQGIVADLWSTKYSEMRSILTPIPDIEEQHQIARYLDWKTTQISKFIKAKKRMIELLKEQKQVTINDAVTGKIDVRTGKLYPKYKDSGVEWLGMVPEEWEVRKLKYIAKLKSGDGITSEKITDTGDYRVFGGNGIRGFTTSFTHEGSFVLIGRQGALCGNINYASGKFWASEHAVVVSPISITDTVWLGETLRTMNLNQYSIAAAQPGLSVERILNLSMPYPVLEDQQAISNFISKEIFKLNSITSSTMNEISLLQEYLNRLIADVVTGKIDVRDVVVPENADDTSDAMDVIVEEEYVEGTDEQFVNE